MTRYHGVRAWEESRSPGQSVIRQTSGTAAEFRTEIKGEIGPPFAAIASPTLWTRVDRRDSRRMPTPREKGDVLELAVQAIESTILRASPSYHEKTFSIESKKVVTVAGVRHEVDIWVSVDLGAGYAALFIFECKNWEERVGKNEIIVFAEKIRTLQAQRGFFVARSFTADAEAQARLDPRITLLRVADLPAPDVPVPFGFHGVNVGRVDAQVNFFGPGATAENRKPEQLELSTASLMIGGVESTAEKYVNEWTLIERDKCVNSFPSTVAEEAIHNLPFEAERSFGAGEASLNGKEIVRARLLGQVQVTVSRPRIISHFEVETRGRVLMLALDLGAIQAKVAFVAPPPS